MRPRAALFYGAGPLFFWAWGGQFTSIGMTRLRNALLAMGIDAECFNFDQELAAGEWLAEALKQGEPTLGYSYSLGNTTLSALQVEMKFHLVFCIAMSELAGRNNRPINKKNVARACLVRGPGELSDALVGGFDEIRYVAEPHLWLDLDAGVKAWALQEAARFL